MQEDLQYYFDIADSLLNDLKSDQCNTASRHSNGCLRCGHDDLVLCYADGCYVCPECGEVSMQQIFEKAWDFCRKFSNYKRIHHFHEHVSQFNLAESSIPEDDMRLIVAQIKEEAFTAINKTNIRKVLRHLKMQHYIEKWLQVMWRVTGQQPPVLSARAAMQLDLMFIQMQLPFMTARPRLRKNFLNYNYVFNRLFQKLGLDQMGMFFPLIKSKSKLAVLDKMWYSICDELRWEKQPMTYVKPFSLRIEAVV
jgi:hypothetical protein